MNPQFQTRRLFLVGTAGLTLTACSLPDLKDIVGPPPPLQLYVLRPALPQAGAAPVPWQLAVALPETTASLDTVRIAQNPTGSTMDYYANASWTDRVPVLMQARLIEAFENTRRVPVTRDTAGLAADYLLFTEIRDFQARYEGGGAPPAAAAADGVPAPITPAPGPPPRVIVQIEAKLMAVRGRRIAATLNASTQANAQANTVESVVVAFNDAVATALTQIVNWTLQQPAPPA